MRLLLIHWLMTLSLFALLARLAVVAIVEHDYYQVLARENRIQVVNLPARRGTIFDRFGEELSADGDQGREYYLGEAGAHVLGYVGGGDREMTGKDGLELSYDGQLRGRPGSLLVETDAGGEIIREIGRNEPAAGGDLTTTLDKGLQQLAHRLMAGRTGAVAAADPQTGAIRALVSAPAYNPGEVAKYLNDSRLPLFNRALGGVYPPGSTFKIITATAALEERKINGQTMIEDAGTVRIGDYSYANWYFTQYGRTEGLLDVIGAIKRSNDIFFYRLGELLGIRALSEWAKFFGAGSQTGIDLPGEAAGVMPDPQWKQMVKKEDWFLGDTLITAIGQGDILMTPLQVNVMTQIMASGGKWCRPHLAGGAECKQLDISPKTIGLVTQGMVQVTQAGGTAFPFFDFPVPVAGKTGTAEFGADEKTHAWFTAFAPAEKPRIVLTVFLEGGGEGSRDAAPLAKELLLYWFNRYGR